ncbi:MAG: peptidoglycan DD-metalloendopeptidase family protein [Bacteroidales bacterium]|nr:peptidoglycan DD-metalloendopeptidase family protein [Bacteroidales bacterium]
MRLLFAFIFVVIFPLIVHGQDKAELERQKQATLLELKKAQELLDATSTRKTNTMRRMSVLDQGIRSREKLMFTIQRETKLIDEEINTLELEIRDLEKSIEKGKEEYAHIIYSIYISHTEEDKLMYLLASEDINEFYQRIKYLKYLKDYRERKVKELELMMNNLEERSVALIKARNEKSLLLIEKEMENKKLLEERRQRNTMIRKLSQDEKNIRAEIREKERIRRELENSIKKVIEEEARRRSSESLLSSLTPEQKLLGDSFLQNKGRLPWPVQRGVITSRFGLVNHPVLSGVKINNNGIDISAAPGTTARAIFDGEVTSVFAILGANYAVIVMHGEYLSVYQNLIDLKVKPGDTVITKQELGTVHADADDGVAVMQLQIWRSKEILDPDLWLSK